MELETKIVNDNEVNIEDRTLYIKCRTEVYGEVQDFFILLENILTTFFYDIYKERIEDKSLSREEYEKVLREMICTNYINYIFLLDNNEEVIYYVNVSTPDDLRKFITGLTEVVY